MIKILVVGQTPPPFHGQSIMIEQMLKGAYENVKLYHVRMGFSRGIDDIGHFQFRKLLHLLLVIMKILFFRIVYNIKILYYPPAGPNKIPVSRDLIVLFFTRWLFKRVIFHFHAGGVSTIYDEFSRFLKWLYRKCYFKPDAAIRLSEYNPEDGTFLETKKEYIVPNGIMDNSKAFAPGKTGTDLQGTVASIPCKLLYVGAVKETKGITVLIETCRILKERGLEFELKVVGQFESDEYRETVTAKVKEYKLEDAILFDGVLTGEDKFQRFANADIFCYPTYFESETFGIVLLEAMQFALPVVATRWRGVQSVVSDGETGYLTPIKDSTAFADKLQTMLENPGLRNKMKKKSKETFQKKYTIKEFHKNMEKVFLETGN